MSTKYICGRNTMLVLLVLGLASLSLAKAGDRPSLRGLVDPPKQARIVNGNVAKHDRFPYFARMDGIGCGGVLISKQFVLTAAHCSEYYVSGFHIGAHSTSDGKFVPADFPILHPDYVDGLDEPPAHDIALVYLNYEVTDVPSVKVSPNMVNVPGTPMSILGFGRTDQYDSSSRSPYLQQADVEYVDSGVCRLDYPKETIDEGMMCASSDEGKDTCSGDSGGPLLLTSGDDPKKDLLVGITSWGYGCGDSRYPGVYTRVSRYYDWIVNEICSLNPESAPEYCAGRSTKTSECGGKGAACHGKDECCSGRCDLFSNTCFSEIPNDTRNDRISGGMGGNAGSITGGAAPSVEFDTLFGRLEDSCGAKGADCDKNDECCSGRCDLSSNTCLTETSEDEGRGGRFSNGVGGAGGGAPPSRGSHNRNNVDAVGEIARDLP